MEREVKKLCDS
ncbi:hypothetical protein NC651_031591 [Populus alba x Populus x berolinensis]|nr:hypothetical protein NC651_031070 [Populus alba x Populus x berolinensis]KAJ6871885.1 hypothetical protein NC651_031078 [Populus alba x Populus x berolinensis]KAJ6872509.1 hypothetical protein NC651_031584 [Populus alba x Populus x berolinensis]KAJ6872517.1 hypothetical protein NC651_031591 [Populus alba x Populus x berolinensis]